MDFRRRAAPNYDNIVPYEVLCIPGDTVVLSRHARHLRLAGMIADEDDDINNNNNKSSGGSEVFIPRSHHSVPSAYYYYHQQQLRRNTSKGVKSDAAVAGAAVSGGDDATVSGSTDDASLAPTTRHHNNDNNNGVIDNGGHDSNHMSNNNNNKNTVGASTSHHSNNDSKSSLSSPSSAAAPSGIPGVAALPLREALQGKTHLLLYFAAHSNPSCQRLTPRLADCYDAINFASNNYNENTSGCNSLMTNKKKNDVIDAEVLFISLDATERDAVDFYTNRKSNYINRRARQLNPQFPFDMRSVASAGGGSASSPPSASPSQNNNTSHSIITTTAAAAATADAKSSGSTPGVALHNHNALHHNNHNNGSGSGGAVGSAAATAATAGRTFPFSSHIRHRFDPSLNPNYPGAALHSAGPQPPQSFSSMAAAAAAAGTGTGVSVGTQQGNGETTWMTNTTTTAASLSSSSGGGGGAAAVLTPQQVYKDNPESLSAAIERQHALNKHNVFSPPASGFFASAGAPNKGHAEWLMLPFGEEKLRKRLLRCFNKHGNTPCVIVLSLLPSAAAADDFSHSSHSAPYGFNVSSSPSSPSATSRELQSSGDGGGENGSGQEPSGEVPMMAVTEDHHNDNNNNHNNDNINNHNNTSNDTSASFAPEVVAVRFVTAMGKEALLADPRGAHFPWYCEDEYINYRPSCHSGGILRLAGSVAAYQYQQRLQWWSSLFSFPSSSSSSSSSFLSPSYSDSYNAVGRVFSVLLWLVLLLPRLAVGLAALVVLRLYSLCFSSSSSSSSHSSSSSSHSSSSSNVVRAQRRVGELLDDAGDSVGSLLSGAAAAMDRLFLALHVSLERVEGWRRRRARRKQRQQQQQRQQQRAQRGKQKRQGKKDKQPLQQHHQEEEEEEEEEEEGGAVLGREGGQESREGLLGGSVASRIKQRRRSKLKGTGGGGTDGSKRDIFGAADDTTDADTDDDDTIDEAGEDYDGKDPATLPQLRARWMVVLSLVSCGALVGLLFLLNQ